MRFGGLGLACRCLDIDCDIDVFLFGLFAVLEVQSADLGHITILGRLWLGLRLFKASFELELWLDLWLIEVGFGVGAG